VYELYAVSNHYGSLGGGHYTAYAKNHRENKWYKFDDSSASSVQAESVKTSAAYVLFYRLKEDANEWRGTRKSPFPTSPAHLQHPPPGGVVQGDLRLRKLSSR
jgi:ubiquitin carboxyl-terminal hydrolase 4/11/15